MGNYVIDYEENQFAHAAGMELLPATFGEGLGAAFQEQVQMGPTDILMRANERRKYEAPNPVDEFGDQYTATTTDPLRQSPTLTAKDANEKYGLGGALQFDADIPEAVAKQIYDRKIQEFSHADTMRRADAGLGTNLLAGIAATVRDPIYLVFSFIPIVGEARFEAMAIKYGMAAARLGTGTIEGAVGAGMVEPIILAGAREEQADYSATDSLMNVVFGGVLGGGLHLGAGFIHDRWTGRDAGTSLQRNIDDLPVQDRAAIIMGAAEQLEAQRPVDLQPVVDAALQKVDDSQYLSPHETRIQEFEARARGVGLTEEQIKTLHPEDIRDPVTGFFKAEERIPAMERAQQFVSQTGKRGIYVEADIANVGGLNAKFGHAETDVIYRELSDIFKQAIEESGGTSTLFRHGGDEISAIVIGVEPETVTQALLGMKRHVDDLVERRGLASIPHAKDRRLPGGTRLYNAISEIDPDATPKEIFKMADLKVEAQKKESLNVRQTRKAGPRAPEARSRGFGSGDRRAAEGIGRKGQAQRTGEAFRRWTDQQSKPYVAPETHAGMKAAAESAKIEAGPPKELASLIADVEAELKDFDARISPEDYAAYDAEYGAEAGEPELYFKNRTVTKTEPMRPSMPDRYSSGPSTAATKPIAKVLYRETDDAGLASLLLDTYKRSIGETVRMFVADDPDLAIGQGANKGVHIQFRENALSGTEHMKPGTGIEGVTGKEFVTDFVVRDPIDRIDAPADMRMKGAARTFLSTYFDKTIEGDRAIYTRKAQKQAIEPSKQLTDAENTDVAIYSELVDQAANCMTGRR